jgi:hypothetical protein
MGAAGRGLRSATGGAASGSGAEGAAKAGIGTPFGGVGATPRF